jgi:hypothetical protein
MAQDMSHLERLGALAANVEHRAWCLPPNCSIKGVVMRELSSADDLEAMSRIKVKPDTTMAMLQALESRELVRQAIVAWTTDMVPSVPIVDEDGKPVLDVFKQPMTEPQYDKVRWIKAEMPVAQFDNWSRSTIKTLADFNDELNGVEVAHVKNSIASGRAFNPTGMMIAYGGNDSPTHQSSTRGGGQKSG